MFYRKEYAGKWLAVKDEKKVIASAESFKDLIQQIEGREDKEELAVGHASKHVYAG